MDLFPGARLGPYEITAQIGAGGMGEVDQATDTNLKRVVCRRSPTGEWLPYLPEMYMSASNLTESAASRLNPLMVSVIVVVAALAGCGGGPSTVPFDLVLQGGTVMDPASGLNAVRDVGVRDGRIEAVSETALEGARVIDAAGLVVVPGFIDLHRHGQTDEDYRSMVRDGVTTGLELEIGTANVENWYASRAPGQVVNYGVSAGHVPVRMTVMDDPGTDLLPVGAGATAVASPEQLAELEQLVDNGLAQGALALGFGLVYTPGATEDEFMRILRLAARHGVSAHIHLRDGLAGLVEGLEAAAEAGVPLHVVHVNSSGGADTAAFLRMIQDANESGQDVTTEAYPYEAGMSQIEAARFDDWETWDDERFQAIQWLETGERLTRESFGRYRAQGGRIARHTRTEEMTRTAIASPLAMIASDGRVVNGLAHPRAMGTFSKVLGKYVREDGVLSLMEALRRMTIEPARRLEARAPQMANKGRVQVGADADLTVFNPRTVIDRATYQDGTIPPEGIDFVVVNGVVVVDRGQLVEGVRPGRPIRASVN